MNPVKTYPAVEIAKCIICKADKNSKDYEDSLDFNDVSINDMTNMKLQKFLYFAQIISLAKNRKPLFSEEIQAWQYGPVVPVVYELYKDKGVETIRPEADERCETDPNLEIILNMVFELYNKYSSRQLVEITHKHAPWKDVYKPDERGIVITNSSIENFYKDSFIFS